MVCYYSKYGIFSGQAKLSFVTFFPSKSEASKKVPQKLDMVSPPETPECVRSGGGSNPHHFLIARISSVFGIGIWKKVRGKRRRKYQVMYAGTKE